MATQSAMRKQDLAHQSSVVTKLDEILERLGQLEELVLSASLESELEVKDAKPKRTPSRRTR